MCQGSNVWLNFFGLYLLLNSLQQVRTLAYGPPILVYAVQISVIRVCINEKLNYMWRRPTKINGG